MTPGAPETRGMAAFAPPGQSLWARLPLQLKVTSQQCHLDSWMKMNAVKMECSRFVKRFHPMNRHIAQKPHWPFLILALSSPRPPGPPLSVRVLSQRGVLGVRRWFCPSKMRGQDSAEQCRLRWRRGVLCFLFPSRELVGWAFYNPRARRAPQRGGSHVWRSADAGLGLSALDGCAGLAMPQ